MSGKGRDDGRDIVLLYYLYTDLSNRAKQVCEDQKSLVASLDLFGRIRVTEEGLNGTLDGTALNIGRYMATMDSTFGKGSIHWKLAKYPAPENRRFISVSVKVKEEVVAMHMTSEQREAALAAGAGQHLTPSQFHEELKAPSDDLVLLDVRNFYETRIGRFEYPPPPSSSSSGSSSGNDSINVAVDPATRAFSDFPTYLSENEHTFKGKKVLMYCTGGVRCERASALLKAMTSPAEVYQLHGGIHAYQEQFPGTDGFFKGKNFVYDPRVAVSATDAQQHKVEEAALYNLVTGDSGKDSGGDGDVLSAIVSATGGLWNSLVALVTPSSSNSSSSSSNSGSGSGNSANATGGIEAKADKKVIGNCCLCDKSWDSYCSPYDSGAPQQTRCTYCRVLLLVCDDCKTANSGSNKVGNGGQPFLKSLHCELCAQGMGGNAYSKGGGKSSLHQ